MAQQHTRPPFSSYLPTQSQVTYSGPMSYNAAMHGSAFSSTLPVTPFPTLTDPSSLPPEPTYHDISVATHKQIATLQAKLDQKLGPEYISQRPGPGGGPKLTYAEGWKIINLANEVFGFNGWSSSICSLNVDYVDPHDEGRRWNCGVSAVVRVTLRDGVYHEDVGYGVAENIKSKGAALDKCKKEAVTDAIKRTLRNFGNLLGNCLYDKQYTQEVVKIKVQPPKFDRSALHRRPEFEDGASGNGSGSGKAGSGAGGATSAAQVNPNGSANNSNNARNMPPPAPPNRVQQQSGKANPPGRIKAEPSAPNPHPAPHAQHAPAAPQRPAPSPATRLAPISAATSLARAPSIDADEVSYFNSDDDALFMQLDMDGVGSVTLEEDRPIEYADVDAKSANVRQNESEARNPVEQSAHVPQQGSGPLSGPLPAPDTTNAHIHSGPRGQPQRNRAPQPIQQRPHHHAAQAQQQHRPQPHPNHNQQPRPGHQISKPGQASPAPRPATPSMGSFHFPPGVNPSSRTSTRLSGPSIGVPGPAQVAGMKRSADAMSPQDSSDQTSSSRLQGNAQGQAGQSNNAGGSGSRKQREPLAPLEVGDGGDVKRARR